MNKKLILTISIILITITISIIVYFSFQKPDKPRFIEPNKAEQTTESFKIYIPSSNSLISKEIYFKEDEAQLKNIEKILEFFLIELPAPFKESKVFGLYRDKENTIYIDFSKKFASPQSMREEYFILKSLYRTLKENFVWINDIKILIDGKEVETLSGHISLQSSFKEIMEEG
ncbi:MAG TPA: GerMN domain-containing protein [Thermodesulfovibrio thiophilus]|uniref:GerMN domain-containing protein n=1 Tax=Thermodesulfovibrio thiophilus TaxID=340095 RepID=UPI000417256C|nr:GerMN domain-containing protein [Thermodesulfovibrio thiophilus]HOA83281.1 GerMN domain-containing protein [Thermodesulfovibrio thiophilus]HQA03663.1 GerMN domain-containing protein [Thermodesulfovibrio thiophilus]HQD36516.1 GerMN domain-containing protein [Thermodesulfovibrio thiophilus]